MQPDGWREMPLESFVTLHRGYDLPECERRAGTVPVIGSAGLTGYHDTARTPGPGVTIGRSGVGSMGVVSYAPSAFWPHNTVLFVCDFHGNDPRFAYYLLRSMGFRRFNSGSAQASLNRNHIHPLPVVVPPLTEQRMIAHILGTLDDKIELNRRQNEILEAIARALFKSWFVDFDPVRAKAEGRDPVGMDAATAALFPDRLVESELGLAPEGWKVSRLADEFRLTMGQSPPGEAYNEIGDGLPFYQGKRDFGAFYPSRRVFCTEPTRVAELGDTLVTVRAPVGDLNVAIEKCCIGRGLAAVRHQSEAVGFTFLAMTMLRPHFERFESEGTVFGSINKASFERLPVVRPPHAVVRRFSMLTEPLFDKLRTNYDESDTLASKRDALLPRLLSGEMRVDVRGTGVSSEAATPCSG